MAQGDHLCGGPGKHGLPVHRREIGRLEEAKYSSHKGSGELNDLKLKVKAIEQTEKQLLDTILAGGFNEDLLTIANQKASQLKRTVWLSMSGWRN